MTARKPLASLLVALTCLTGSQALAQTEVIATPLPPVYKASSVYSLKANGKEVPISAFANLYDYAVFSAADGAIELELTRLDGKPIESHSVSPLKLNIAGNASGSTLKFSVNKQSYLIVSIDNLRKLVIAIDPPETNQPAPTGPGIYNVTAAPYRADPTGSRPSTNALQRAVNDAGKDTSKAGVVYVPNGVYNLTELQLVSDVTLYLEPGAVLRLNGKREDFKMRYKKNSQNRSGTWFIYTADGARNVKILGRGTIDGDGRRIEKELDITSHLVVPMNCTGFEMDGPVIRESGLWGTVIANSSKVTLRNTKHLNPHDMGENDCVDVCNSQDVLVQRSIGISLDDPYSTKTWEPKTDIALKWTGPFEANRNIVFDDCLSWTRCFAFKVGAGVCRDQENITIRNSVVYDSAHAFGISHSYGSANVKGVLVDTMDVERNTMDNLGRSWLRVYTDKRKPDGGLGGSTSDIHLRNITVRDPGTMFVPVVGLSENQRVKNLTFEKIYMLGRPTPASTLAEIGILDSKFAEGIQMKN